MGFFKRKGFCEGRCGVSGGFVFGDGVEGLVGGGGGISYVSFVFGSLGVVLIVLF